MFVESRKNQPRKWKIGGEIERQAGNSGNLKINQKEIFLEWDSNQLLNSVDRQGKDQELRPLVTLKRKFSEAWWRWNPEWNGFKIEKGETSRRIQTTIVKSFSLRERKVKTTREGSRDITDAYKHNICTQGLLLREALGVLYGKGRGTLTLDGLHFILLLLSKWSCTWELNV